MEGKVVADKYKIIRTLGQGSQGVAFLASNIKTHRQYVLKRLETGAKSSAELRMMQKIRHPNIIQLEDSFKWDGLVYLVLRYAEGGDLEHFIADQMEKKKRIPIPTVVSWFNQLASALQYCHDNRVVHRDIKPGNVFLSKDLSTVYLGDFGVAKVLDAAAIAQTMVGSPACLSPEVISENKYSSASDVWSLGCILYEMATMKHPFQVDNIGQLIARVCSGKYDKVPRDTPQFLAKAIEGMLTVNVADRWLLSDVVNSSEQFSEDIPYVDQPSAEEQPRSALNGSVKPGQIESTLTLDIWMKAKMRDFVQIEKYLKKHREGDTIVLNQVAAKSGPTVRTSTPEMNQGRAKRMLPSPNKEGQRPQTPPNPPAFKFQQVPVKAEPAPAPAPEPAGPSDRELKRRENQKQLRNAMAEGRKGAKPAEAAVKPADVAVVVKGERKKSAPLHRAPSDIQLEAKKDAPLRHSDKGKSPPPPVPEPTPAPQAKHAAGRRQSRPTPPPPQAKKEEPKPAPKPAPKQERQALKDMIKEQRAKQAGSGTAEDFGVEIVIPGNLRKLPQNQY